MRYVALLRGINVGGKNKVAMVDLKDCLDTLGFNNVVTYINSGNVVFDYDKTDTTRLIKKCEAAIEHKFGFRIVCNVLEANKLIAAVKHAPSWWGADKSSKHNAIFAISPLTPTGIVEHVGATKPEYEQVACYGPVVFWSAPIDTFSRTRYSKIVGTKIYRSVTIRNANTVRKLVELCSQRKGAMND